MTNEEYEYLVEHEMLIKLYQRDQNPETSNCEPSPGEPGLLFHEFTFLLAMIALQQDSESMDSEKRLVPSTKIENFFVRKLQFNKVPDQMRTYKPFDFHLEKA